MDTASNGAWAKIYPSRLAGYTLSTDDVRYYVTNTSGEITHLLLDDATGDTWSYYYLTSVPEKENGTLSGSYSGLKSGSSVTLDNNGKTFGVDAGGVGVQFNSDGEIKSMRQLLSVTLDSLSSVSAMGGNTTYKLDSGVQVYLRKRDASYVLNYYQVDLGSVNASDYKLTGWVDNFGNTAGKQVRVIIAEEK